MIFSFKTAVRNPILHSTAPRRRKQNLPQQQSYSLLIFLPLSTRSTARATTLRQISPLSLAPWRCETAAAHTRSRADIGGCSERSMTRSGGGIAENRFAKRADASHGYRCWSPIPRPKSDLDSHAFRPPPHLHKGQPDSRPPPARRIGPPRSDSGTGTFRARRGPEARGGRPLCDARSRRRPRRRRRMPAAGAPDATRRRSRRRRPRMIRRISGRPRPRRRRRSRTKWSRRVSCTTVSVPQVAS